MGLKNRGATPVDIDIKPAIWPQTQIDHLLDRPCHELSFGSNGGSRRRIARLEAIALLLDEPTAGLDLSPQEPIILVQDMVNRLVLKARATRLEHQPGTCQA